MAVLKVTFVDGTSHLFPFDATSTLHVETTVREDSLPVGKSATWSEVVAVSIEADQIASEPTPEPEAVVEVQAKPKKGS